MGKQKITVGLIILAILVFVTCSSPSNSTTPSLLMEMVQINAGTFQMGSPNTEIGHNTGEILHEVKLNNSFYMGKYAVTQKQWSAIMGTTIVDQQILADIKGDGISDWGRGDNFPIYCVSWYEAVVFCNKLSMIEGLTPVYTIGDSINPNDWMLIAGGSIPSGINVTWSAAKANWNASGYRLPTEAEWEYACRAETTTAFNWGSNQITSDHANFDASQYIYNSSPVGVCRGKLTPVTEFAPNKWGLYNMHGNVAEWCWDWYEMYYGVVSTEDLKKLQIDPRGPDTGTVHTRRGGSWGQEGLTLRSANRAAKDSTPNTRWADIGFRVVRNK